ncbi:MAG: 3'-5' exonuclease, partial [Bradymonadaceae bacterium]
GAYDDSSDRLDDLRQLADFAHSFPDLDRFLGEISLLTDVSGKGVLVGEDRDDYVTLSSLHQAKGLEWPVVFLLSLAEDQFPHHRSVEEDTLDEERRLFYVATTRARDELYLCQPTRASGRGGGRMEILRASQFIRELQDDPRLEEKPWEKWVVEE